MNVSIIIPALNEARLIGRAIEYAWQAGANQVIVADGGSHDATPEIATRLGCLVVTGVTGRAVQQNAGARQADGDILLFQHADSWLGPAALSQVKEVCRDERVLGGAFRQRIEAAGAVYRLLEKGNAARARWLGLPYGDQGIFLRREVFAELQGFPEVDLMEDLLLMRALRRLAWPVLLPGPICVSARRWQQRGVVRQTLRNWSLLTGYALGVSPDRLARYYPRHDS